MKKLEAAISNATDKKGAYEAIINFYDNARQPILAAYYMEQAAIASPIDSNWTYAGARYYSAIQFSKPTEHPMLYKKAIECFEKTLSINPKNLDARISLAACYVEGSADPMKGIGMLREIEKTDSNNVNLQLNFAFFSERSGQWDKAIARFEKVLKIKPDFIVDLAVASNIDYIITFNISNFLNAKKINIKVITPKEFLQVLGEIQ